MQPPVPAHVPRLFRIVVAVAAVLWIPVGLGAQTSGYKLPPADVVEILDAPEAPWVAVSPDRACLVLVHRTSMPSLAEMSRPMPPS